MNIGEANDVLTLLKLLAPDPLRSAHPVSPAAAAAAAERLLHRANTTLQLTTSAGRLADVTDSTRALARRAGGQT
jgi:hypothetical protein